MTTTSDTLTLEPKTRQDLGVQVLSSLALGLAYLVFVAAPCAAAALSYLVWEWWITATLGLLASAIMVACGFTIARLTRDDRSLGARLQAGDEAISVLPAYIQRVAELEAQTKMGVPVVHVDVPGAKFVQPEAKDTAWQDARSLLAMVTGDYGYIPGREKSRLTQDQQSAALGCLARAGVLALKGRNRYALCMTRGEAAARLEEKVRLSI